MKRTFKILAWLLSILVAIIVATGTAIVLFFDPNDYKDEIAAFVKKETGRDLTIAGRITLSLFPWVGVEIHRIALANAGGFGPDPFLKVEDAGVRVRLLPLLKREVEIDTVMLHGLELHLAVDERGRGNWEDLLPRETPSREGREQ
ncbi:MAG: AsmA family protein, partial [Gammaproteobacteria bacterium]